VGGVILAPWKQPSYTVAAPIDPAEHAKTIKEMGAPRHERPSIAIVSVNEATEVTDLMIPYGVLKRADVADVAIVAEHTSSVALYPFSKLGQGSELFKVEPQATLQDFDKQHPDGADYVVIPAVLPRDNPAVVNWIKSQHQKGANIVSVCAGSITLAATGLLDDRRSTSHWAYIDELKEAHPTTKIVPDRRYVSDNHVTTATGISASLPLSVAIVEAIAGKQKAQQVAQDLGLDYWDERHLSSNFELTWEHKKSFVRNSMSFWRKQTVGVPVNNGMDEVVLALTADVYSRTLLSKAVTVGDTIRGKYGLTIHPNTADAASIDMLPAPESDKPALTIDRELNHIAERFDRPTAEIVALTLEYPWMAK